MSGVSDFAAGLPRPRAIHTEFLFWEGALQFPPCVNLGWFPALPAVSSLALRQSSWQQHSNPFFSFSPGGVSFSITGWGGFAGV